MSNEATQLEGAVMALQRLTNPSRPLNSPHVHRREDNHLVVSGFEVDDPAIPLDDGERAVRLPAVLVLDAVTQLGGEMSWADLDRMFDNFAESAFRVETLPFYAVESNLEALEHYLATGELLYDEECREWDRMVADHLAAGRTMQRIHTLRLPLTDYLEWELKAHAHQSPEPLRILDLDDHPELVEIEEMGDAWIFDERVGARLCYDDHGTFTHLERLGEDELEKYLTWRDRSWKVAVPVTEFLAAVD